MTKSGKHCGKRRNCTFCAISSFVTMFSKRRLLQRRQKAFICGYGLNTLMQLSFSFFYLYGVLHHFNPFPHTTILQQTTLNIFCQMDNLWLKVENIVTKVENARSVQFLLLSLCFQNAVCFNPFPHTTILQQTTSNVFF